MKLIIIFTILLIIWHYLGWKKNKKILIKYINELDSIIKCKDKRFINIGGVIGVFSEFLIDDRFLDKIEISIVLIPRQSVWAVFSYLFYGYDKMRINCIYKKKIEMNFKLLKTYNFYLSKSKKMFEEYIYNGNVWYLYYDESYNERIIRGCLKIFSDNIQKIEAGDNFLEVELMLKKNFDLKEINILIDFLDTVLFC